MPLFCTKCQTDKLACNKIENQIESTTIDAVYAKKSPVFPRMAALTVIMHAAAICSLL